MSSKDNPWLHAVLYQAFQSQVPFLVHRPFVANWSATPAPFSAFTTIRPFTNVSPGSGVVASVAQALSEWQSQGGPDAVFIEGYLFTR